MPTQVSSLEHVFQNSLIFTKIVTYIIAYIEYCSVLTIHYYHFTMDYNSQENEEEPESDSEIDVFSKAAMNNAYYISHNIQVSQKY